MHLNDLKREIVSHRLTCPHCKAHLVMTTDLRVDSYGYGRKFVLEGYDCPQNVYFVCFRCGRPCGLPKHIVGAPPALPPPFAINESTAALFKRLGLDATSHPKVAGWMQIEVVKPT